MESVPGLHKCLKIQAFKVPSSLSISDHSYTQLDAWMKATDVDQNGDLSFEEFKFAIVGTAMIDA